MRLISILFLLTGLAVASAQSPRAAKTVSEADARAFGEELQREFEKNGPDFFVKALDVARLSEIALAGQPGKEETKDGFRAGLMKGRFSTSLAKGMEAFSSYKLLRVIATNERPRLVFRCLSEEGALNYHILEVERPRDTRIRIVDMFVMVSGEKMSETLRRLYLVAAAEADRSLLSRLALGEGDLVKHGKDLQELVRMARAGDSEGALKLYASLPESLRSEKSVLVTRLLAAQAADEKVYLSAIEDFEKYFPNDPSLALVSIDGFVLKKQPRRAIAAVQKLDRFIGGDPYLLLLQAGQYYELKEKPKARELALKVTEQEPSLATSYDLLLSFAIEDKDYTETARLLSLTEKNLQVDMLEAIKDEKEYAAFLESTPGKKWKEDHKTK